MGNLGIMYMHDQNSLRFYANANIDIRQRIHKTMNTPHNDKVAFKTRQEIAAEYGVHRRTLLRWLKRASIDLPKGLVCPRNQFIIYSVFGFPEGIAIPNTKMPERDSVPICPILSQN